jgi:hypothetical protein
MFPSAKLASLIVALTLLLALAPGPAPARAGILDKGCSLIGTIGEGWWGKACKGVADIVGKSKSAAGKAKKVAGVIGKVASNPALQRAASLAAIVAWVLGGAHWTISHVASAISQSTSPALSAGWFGTVYLKMEGIAWLLTLPFLAAAAAQAVLRSDLHQ